jgi:hypothetical protein
VETWPEGWEIPNSQCRQLCDEWGKRWLQNNGEVAFFRKHKDVMCRGMVLNSPKAYMHHVKSAADDKRKKKTARPVNACHAVLREYYSMGHEAFMAERQQRPVNALVENAPYTINPEIIMSRTTKREPWQREQWMVNAYASTDMNVSYAMSTVVPAFGVDQTAGVLWYGLHTDAPLPISKETPMAEREKMVYAALSILGRKLATYPVKPELWGIDASGDYFQTVCKFALASVGICGIQAVACSGRNGKDYKPYGPKVITIRQECHTRRCDPPNDRLRWLMWNADFWREVSQRAWLGDIGAPGSISLCAGQHYDFAAQASAEYLVRKGPGLSGRTEWIWRKPAPQHDYGDALAQAYALAAFGGIGTGGQVVRRKYVETRRCKVQRED